MRQVILVNGVPASGKSTVLKRVTDDLIDRGIAAVPLTLDNVKEGLFEEIGIGDRDHNRMLGRASYRAIFNSIAAFPDALVPLVDAWHGFQPPEVLNAHLARARTDHVVEIWCDVTPATAAARYRARSAERHAGHLPPSYAEELFALAASAAPRALGPVIRIDGEAPLGTGDLDRIHRALTAP
ncbi:MAG: AAA family ATPase [Paracoccaceae bacterium]|nr:AAA family ATPase [Paracoccaceae bacterium]